MSKTMRIAIISERTNLCGLLAGGLRATERVRDGMRHGAQRQLDQDTGSPAEAPGLAQAHRAARVVQ